MLPSGPPRRRNNAFVSSCCQATTKSGAWLLVLCASNAASGAGLLPPPLMCCPSSCFLAFVCSEPTGVSGAEVSAEEGRSITRGNTRRVSCVCVCVCVCERGSAQAQARQSVGNFFGNMFGKRQGPPVADTEQAGMPASIELGDDDIANIVPEAWKEGGRGSQFYRNAGFTFRVGEIVVAFRSDGSRRYGRILQVPHALPLRISSPLACHPRRCHGVVAAQVELGAELYAFSRLQSSDTGVALRFRTMVTQHMTSW